MRRTVSNTVAALLVTVLAAVVPATAFAAPPAPSTTGNVRITPAAIKLELAKGASEVRTTFTLKSTYSTAVTMRFSLSNASQNIQGNVNPTTLIAIEKDTLVIPANGSVTQALILRDSDKLSPGSQALELVVAQQNGSGQNGQSVGVQPAVRLPVSIIKNDGAIAKLGLMNITSPGFAMQTPASVDVTVQNTGNMTAIPRGSITIRDPHGKEVGHGVINAASAAVTPGKSITMPVPITAASTATLPGSYQIQATYGLGGDTSEKTSSIGYAFFGWQHVALAVITIGAVIAIVRSMRIALRYMKLRRKRHEPAKAPPTKRRILIGRNA